MSILIITEAKCISTAKNIQCQLQNNQITEMNTIEKTNAFEAIFPNVTR